MGAITKYTSLLVIVLTGILVGAGQASAQINGTFDWSALGLSDEAAVPSGTTFTSGGVTTTITWSIVTDGGSFIPAFGNDFLSYEDGTSGTITQVGAIGFDNDARDPEDKIIIDFAFSEAVRNVQFTLTDIDENTFDDIVEVYYDTGSGFINARTGSFATVGAKVAEDDEAFAEGWEGTANVSNSSVDGNLALDFGLTSVTALRVVYFSGDDTVEIDPSAQILSISNIAYSTIGPTVDLELSKTVNEQFPLVGETVSYILTLANAGPDTATGVQILDLLPSGLSYISDDSSGAYNSGTGVWTVPGSLASGGQASLQINASVNATGSYVNSAEVSASDLFDFDSVPNNSGTEPFEDDTDTVTIFPGSAPPTCPTNTTLNVETGFASSVETDTSISDESFALGPISAAGTAPPDNVAGEMNSSSDYLVLDLRAVIPQDTLLTFSLARDGGSAGSLAQVEILFSIDGISFTSAGVYGAAPADYLSSAQDVIEHITVVSPVSGAQFIAFDTLNSDDIFVDGIQYDHTCIGSATLSATKTMSVIATSVSNSATCAILPPPGTNNQYALPGACVEYTITVEHIEGADTNNIELVDPLPNFLTFAGANATNFTGGMVRTTDTATPPNAITCTSLTPSCVIRFEGGSLSAGDTGEVKVRALVK